jgi:hypothetical protein
MILIPEKSLGGRQAVGGNYANFVYIEYGYPMEKSTKAPGFPPSKLRRAHNRSRNKTSCSSLIYTIRIRVPRILILADFLSHW